MYIFRLFHRDHPHEQIGSRLFDEGALTIGRDPGADWSLEDVDGVLSRIHCSLVLENGRLLLRDSSSNGTYLNTGQRAPKDQPVALAKGDIIRLGALSILVDQPLAEAAEISAAPLPTAATAVPTDWTDAGVERPAHRDASLIEAFCDGAKLDASALSGEDPAELMRRVGAIYQQTILGLATLMAERTRLKSEHQLERTTVGAINNNPFKWAATRRVAQDLLCKHDSGFLSDAEAVRASFEDLGQHLAAVATGASAATNAVLRALDPSTIDAEARRDGFSLRSPAAARWELYHRRYAALMSQDLHAGGPIARAFADGYNRPEPRGPMAISAVASKAEALD